MKSITLCADDYGQNSAISQAIIDLLKQKKLSATSCMTNMTQWLTHAAWLAPYKDQADLGIHLNLTEGSPISTEFKQAYGDSFPSLTTLLRKCFLRQMNSEIIYAELQAQLEQFTAGVGHLPHFIDGHQHIHHFPIIREALFKLYETRLRGADCYIRHVDDPYVWRRIFDGAYIKRLIIQLSGAHAFKQQLIALNIPHNSSFSGIYDFYHQKDFATLFPKFLKESKQGGIIMCHPGLSTANNANEIPSRLNEYRYFNSQKFQIDCDLNQVKIARFDNP